MKYITGAIGLVAIGSMGLAYYQSQRIEALQGDRRVAEHELSQCGAHLTNVLEDIRSDTEIDNLPDSALTDVPPHWLLGGDEDPGG